MSAGLAGLESVVWLAVSGRGEGAGRAGLLCQLVVGEGVGVGSLPVEFLLGKRGVAFFFVGFAVILALLALACCCHCDG